MLPTVGLAAKSRMTRSLRIRKADVGSPAADQMPGGVADLPDVGEIDGRPLVQLALAGEVPGRSSPRRTSLIKWWYR